MISVRVLPPALLAVLYILPGAVAAVIDIAFGIDDIEGDGWRAQGISIGLQSAGVGEFGARLTIDTLELPDANGTLHGVLLDCESLVRDSTAWRCAAGRLQVQESPLEGQEGTWEGIYQADGAWQLGIPRLVMGQGTIALEASGEGGQWKAGARLHRLTVDRLADLIGTDAVPADWGFKGWVSGLLNAGGGPDGLSRVSADLVGDQLTYGAPDGRNAAENLVVKAGIDARLRGTAWSFDVNLGMPRGALYVEPVFLDAEKSPLSARAGGHWQADPDVLQFDAWSMELPGVVSLSGTGRLQGQEPAVADLTVVARSDDAAQLYGVLLQPFLIGSAGDDLEASGRLGLALHFDAQGIEQAGLDVTGLVLDDRQGRFSLGRTDGSVAWDRNRQVPVSRLTVQGAAIYRIPTGAFSIRAGFAGDRVSLVEPVVVPVLGGEIALDSFELSGALVAGEKPRWEASASVREVSLEQLTTTLNWPPFGGTVAGQLRNMRYQDQEFSIGGGLQLKAFDGDIRVSDLRIQDPLGLVPTLQAAAELRGLSLEALTQAFSFGRIEGRLDGDISGLQLLAWQPDRFDLHLYTPPDDDSRRRISQRAVENLTELGSGVPAGLSTTVLRIFKDFSYDRIDVRIVLQGSVAELDGLARPDGGYYLVRGAGLPRIDVIGRNRSVAWQDLVERLRGIQVEGARIE